MAELGVLTCPVCDKHCLCDEERERGALKNDARDHLHDHDLPEGKRGIYSVMMVERMDHVENADGETGRWRRDTPQPAH